LILATCRVTSPSQRSVPSSSPSPPPTLREAPPSLSPTPLIASQIGAKGTPMPPPPPTSLVTSQYDVKLLPTPQPAEGTRRETVSPPPPSPTSHVAPEFKGTTWTPSPPLLVASRLDEECPITMPTAPRRPTCLPQPTRNKSEWRATLRPRPVQTSRPRPPPEPPPGHRTTAAPRRRLTVRRGAAP
jgi:hypothetical protein